MGNSQSNQSKETEYSDVNSQIPIALAPTIYKNNHNQPNKSK